MIRTDGRIESVAIRTESEFACLSIAINGKYEPNRRAGIRVIGAIGPVKPLAVPSKPLPVESKCPATPFAGDSFKCWTVLKLLSQTAVELGSSLAPDP